MKKIICNIGAIVQSLFHPGMKTPTNYMNKEHEENNYMVGLFTIIFFSIILLIATLKTFN